MIWTGRYSMFTWCQLSLLKRILQQVHVHPQVMNMLQKLLYFQLCHGNGDLISENVLFLQQIRTVLDFRRSRYTNGSLFSANIFHYKCLCCLQKERNVNNICYVHVSYMNTAKYKNSNCNMERTYSRCCVHCTVKNTVSYLVIVSQFHIVIFLDHNHTFTHRIM